MTTSPSKLLFLPGASGNTEFWRPAAERIAHSAQQVHIGWPGFGSTPSDPSVTGMADLVARVLLEIDSATARAASPLKRHVSMERFMPFSPEERKALLGVKGVGPTVVARLEQMGFASLAQLSEANALDIVSQASAIVGSTCWKNSPQARAAVQAAIALAKSRHA